ncbi:hypothetical protein PMAYCL1PPCAC_03638, partial [Pristionchus mayeri]
PLLRATASEQREQRASWRLATPSSQNIVVLFLTANNLMYISGFYIYPANEFTIARSFFFFSLMVNFLAYYGIWQRKATPIFPCFLVYTITLIVDTIMCFFVFFFAFGTDYDRDAGYIHDRTSLDYVWSRSLARLLGYFSVCSAGVSIAYLIVLVLALAAIRREYGRDKEILKRVLPSAPPAYDV